MPRLQDSSTPPNPLQGAREESPVAYSIKLLGLTVCCFGAGRLVPIVPFAHGAAPPLWAATGCALAGLLLFGSRFWPAVFLAEFLVARAVGAPWGHMLMVAGGNTLQALAGAYLLRGYVGFRNSLERLQDVLGLILLAACLSTLASAILCGISISFLSVEGWASLGASWWAWRLAHMLGDLVVAPVLLTWATRKRLENLPRSAVETLGLLGSLALVCLVVFGGPAKSLGIHSPEPYLVFPVLVWAAVRFGLRGAVTATLLVAFVGIWCTLHGLGSFAAPSMQQSVILLEAFLVVVAITVLVLAASIGERQQVQESLRHSEEHYRALFESNPHPMWLYDTETLAFLAVNEAALDCYGYSKEEFLAMTVKDVQAPGEADATANGSVSSSAQLRKTGGWRHRKKDASIIDVEIASHDFHFDDRPARLVLAHDITQRRQAELALRASEERYRANEAKYRTLIENLEQSIFLKDTELRFVAVNRRFAEALGLSEAEIVGKSDLDFYPPRLAEKYRADDRQVLHEGKRLALEEENPVAGKLRTVRVVKTPVKDEQGRNIGVLGIFWDVSEQRALEAQLRQAQKMEAVGQLAGGVAHDFNNLLTAILGNLSLVLSTVPADDPNRELLRAAEKASERAAILTRQMLGFSRQTLLRPQPTSLRSVIEEVLALLQRTFDPRITLQIDNPNDLWLVQADPGQMNQILMNLCLNARDAMPEGGRLLLKTENVQLDEDYPRLHLEARPGPFVRLRVEDTGLGIPADIRARIFEPFFTTKGQGRGTGLGLAMVFGIVKQHRGWIDCYSEVGRGTRFDIYLPRSTHDSLVSTPTLPLSASCRGTETILLVDDEAILRDLARMILQKFGYQVLLAEDGMQALDVYQENRAQIQLVVLDLTMPRLSGRDAFQRLVEINPRVRVLFASGYSAEHVNDTSSEQVVGFVSKPYRPEELVQMVRSALDRQEVRGTA